VDSELAHWLHGGPAVIVATRDENLRPEIVRGWAPELAADGTTATLCVGASRDSQTLANLRANGAIAVTAGLPTTYRMVQLKGRLTAMAEPSAEQLGRVEAHVAAFAAEVEPLGLTLEQAQRLITPEFVSVTFAVAEAYDQTPGPRAGARM
jgi:Pyridoxamine 5'-phosphate oxidase